MTVQYDTSDDTATEDANAGDGADYTAASGQTLTFAAGETTQTVSIPTGNDSVDEDDETFHLTLPVGQRGDRGFRRCHRDHR